MKYPLLMLLCLLLWSNAASVYAADTPPAAQETPASDKPDAAKAAMPRALGKPTAHTGAEAGALAQQPAMGTGVLQVTLGLFVVLMVIAAAAWFARRFGHFNVTAKGNLRIIGGLHMGSRERVVLMQVGNQQLLLGVAPGRIQTLHVLDEPIGIDDAAQAPGQHPIQRFSSLLKRYQQS